jgi:hypothetical protein
MESWLLIDLLFRYLKSLFYLPKLYVDKCNGNKILDSKGSERGDCDQFRHEHYLALPWGNWEQHQDFPKDIQQLDWDTNLVRI